MTKIVFIGQTSEQRLDALRREFPGATLVAAPDLEAQLRELPDADATISWPSREALPVAKRPRCPRRHHRGSLLRLHALLDAQRARAAGGQEGPPLGPPWTVARRARAE